MRGQLEQLSQAEVASRLSLNCSEADVPAIRISDERVSWAAQFFHFYLFF